MLFVCVITWTGQLHLLLQHYTPCTVPDLLLTCYMSNFVLRKFKIQNYWKAWMHWQVCCTPASPSSKTSLILRQPLVSFLTVHMKILQILLALWLQQKSGDKQLTEIGKWMKCEFSWGHLVWVRRGGPAPHDEVSEGVAADSQHTVSLSLCPQSMCGPRDCVCSLFFVHLGEGYP